MKVCVQGLWHLGSVTAGCLASVGHEVFGFDFGKDLIQGLRAGKPPIFEPGLEEMIGAGLDSGRLRFTASIEELPSDIQLLWVAYDTPVDEDDVADVDFVVAQVEAVLPFLPSNLTVLVSSQMPVGSVRRMETIADKLCPEKGLSFACSPENLRLGKALDVFLKPDRVVVGVRGDRDRKRIGQLLAPITDRVEWMSVESAEMTKHAINAFLATSVVFANEIAAICEAVGADAKEVERGLKSEQRIGPRAYLAPGSAFAGGTLARDIVFLTQKGREHHLPMHLMASIRASNDEHKNWARRKLQILLGDLDQKRIAVWGLTYKPGTDTLRRSTAVELCEWLVDQGVQVQVHDPAVKVLPAYLAQKLKLCSTPIAALEGAHALVVATEWPEYQSLSAHAIVSTMSSRWVLDANRFLMNTLGADPRIHYAAVGLSTQGDMRRLGYDPQA